MIYNYDLNLQNIFYNHDESMLLKVGFFARISDFNSILKSGNLIYCSPEELNGQSHQFESEVWALGIILYQLASLQIMFKGQLPINIVNSIKSGLTLEIPEFYSDDL